MMIGALRGAAVSKLQFATGSRWEEALIVEKNLPPAELHAWLGRFKDSHIGAEAFFEISGTQAFIGARLAFSPAVGDEAARVAEEFLSRAGFAVCDFIKSAEKISDAPLFLGEPGFMELGLVNMWQSFGPLPFWKKEGGSPFARLNAALLRDGRFASELPAPPAVEIAWDSPLPHWLGVCLSRGVGGKYFLDMAAAEKFLTKDAAFRQGASRCAKFILSGR